MPLSPQSMSSTMQGQFSGVGFTGPRIRDFCDIISTGTVNSIVGKPFMTVDVGALPGAGMGTGVGLLGVLGTATSGLLFSQFGGFGFAGPMLKQLCDVLGTSLELELLKATLSSTHTPVFVGSGTVIPGSIPIVGAEIASMIQSEGASANFVGPMFAQFCLAVGNAFQLSMLTATGQVVIAGAFAGPVPPGPIPGGGAGVGTIS